MKILYLLNFLFIKKSMNYVKTKSMEYKIDNSHNYKHSLDVLKRGKLLMENKGKNYNEISRSIIYLGCILHDMCDHKYMDEKTEMNNISNFLTNDLKLDNKITDAVMTILPRMSYSKTVKNNNFILPKDLENFTYLEEYHIIRHADLLTSYNLFRPIEMRYYQLVRDNKEINMNDIIEESDNIINNRIFKMIEGKIFVDKESLKLAQKYHKQALTKYIKWKKQNITNYNEIKKFLE